MTCNFKHNLLTQKTKIEPFVKFCNKHMYNNYFEHLRITLNFSPFF